MFGFRPRLLSIGVIALAVAICSAWLMLRSTAMFCERLAPLTILATLAAFLISICFRQMGKFKEKRQRWFLFVCILIAGATLFADFRFVRHYRDMCDQLKEQLHHVTSQ
jgi:FtsH-binding integral membrane protein